LFFLFTCISFNHPATIFNKLELSEWSGITDYNSSSVLVEPTAQ